MEHGGEGVLDFPWEVRTTSFNVLYYQGKEISIEGLSNVNTIRRVLDNLLDLDYGLVKVPNVDY